MRMYMHATAAGAQHQQYCSNQKASTVAYSRQHHKSRITHQVQHNSKRAHLQPLPPSQNCVLRPVGCAVEVASFLPQCLQDLSSGCSRLQKPHTMRVAHTACGQTADGTVHHSTAQYGVTESTAQQTPLHVSVVATLPPAARPYSTSVFLFSSTTVLLLSTTTVLLLSTASQQQRQHVNCRGCA
jgi:hypothetical protein